MTFVDGRRRRGEESRSAILKVAVNLASVDGLNGLSIGGLASKTGLSKSGVVALFGTKESLQLATVAAAREIFTREVIKPVLEVQGGRARLDAIVWEWLNYSHTRVFAGGCFFAAATIEVGSKPGPVRDAVATAVDDWYQFIGLMIGRARDLGDLRSDVPANELTFAITAVLEAANARSLITGGSEPYATATAVAKSFLDAQQRNVTERA